MSDDTGDAAAEAFEAVRAEVALLRRAVEGLAAERADAPDYAPTLGTISHNQMVAAQRLDVLAQSPNLSLTPAAIGKQVERAAADLRAGERQTLDGVRRDLEAAATAMTGRLASARDRDDQTLWQWVSAAGGALAGVILWWMITGPVAREMPADWHWPEKIAANTMALPVWDAGMKLLQADDPQARQALIADFKLVEANRDTVNACRKAAAKAGKRARCVIEVGPA